MKLVHGYQAKYLQRTCKISEIYSDLSQLLIAFARNLARYSRPNERRTEIYFLFSIYSTQLQKERFFVIDQQAKWIYKKKTETNYRFSFQFVFFNSTFHGSLQDWFYSSTKF